MLSTITAPSQPSSSAQLPHKGASTRHQDQAITAAIRTDDRQREDTAQLPGGVSQLTVKILLGQRTTGLPGNSRHTDLHASATAPPRETTLLINGRDISHETVMIMVIC